MNGTQPPLSGSEWAFLGLLVAVGAIFVAALWQLW